MTQGSFLQFQLSVGLAFSTKELSKFKLSTKTSNASFLKAVISSSSDLYLFLNIFSLSNLNASFQRYMSTFSAKAEESLSSFALTKYPPNLVSSELKLPSPYSSILSLIFVANSAQLTFLSQMLLLACFQSAILFGILFIFQRRLKAVSSVNTFWSAVFIVAMINRLAGIVTGCSSSPYTSFAISALLIL